MQMQKWQRRSVGNRTNTYGDCDWIRWPEVCSDMASGLALLVFVVAADRLGTLNHTLLTIEAVRMRGLTLAGFILNQPALQTDCMRDNAAELEW